jgi:hypothetical protein
VEPHNLGIILVVSCVFSLMVLLIVWSNSRGLSMLDVWASENGYDILSREACWFFRGPFFWGTSEGQKVYKVTLRDQDGRVRHGYARCGGYWLGLWTDRVEVRWDD